MLEAFVKTGEEMTIMMDDYPALLRKIESLKKDIQQQEGAARQMKKSLRSEFGCKTIKEAKTKHAKMLKRQQLLASQYIKLKTRFEKKWRKRLNTDTAE